MDLLFVYGTLRSEFSNRYAKALRSEADLIGPAETSGSIFRIAHYPGYRPHPPGIVHGELYRMHDPAATLAALDDYEGADFERTEVTVRGAGAWIYRYCSQPPENARIASGDFCRP
ncbi:MAG TPA: gamma-glutamylcyclotransferase family protein [Bryobacteraceae bacterium]|nr:gamma-glutamylcyclotransferase family protein [Bryobacteraceae bacterium]